MKFVWDEIKAERVYQDHRIEFPLIIDIFDDAYAIEFVDETHSSSDDMRFAIVGMTGAYGLIHLVFSEVDFEGELALRFITARRAEPWMVDEYEDNRRKK